ncbi:unnamed protein product [Effrenium voratum]|uniref:Uncharacterized protein n=1 Tax=Effrenium voratum TaxID=2562239 RepID=A0AA36NHR3_9DINO|nr:unnamed protein product [Effrenium voratum]CAJ1414880.1 unnamed protein product [Effrenium voratum]
MSRQMLALICLARLDPLQAAGNCAKLAGCINMEGGDQVRPILTGEQSFTEADGSCTFGHVAQDAECKPGPGCGYTLFECLCISREIAEMNSLGARQARLLCGAAAAVVSCGVWLCVFLARRPCQHRARIMPGGIFPETIGSSDRFTPVCVEQAPVIAEEMAKQPKKWDMLTWTLVGALPAICMAVGVAVIISGLSIQVGEYYNGCRI